MKKKGILTTVMILVVSCLALNACANGATSFDTAQLEEKANGVIEKMLAGDYQAAVADFAPE